MKNLSFDVTFSPLPPTIIKNHSPLPGREVILKIYIPVYLYYVKSCPGYIIPQHLQVGQLSYSIRFHRGVILNISTGHFHGGVIITIFTVPFHNWVILNISTVHFHGGVIINIYKLNFRWGYTKHINQNTFTGVTLNIFTIHFHGGVMLNLFTLHFIVGVILNIFKVHFTKNIYSTLSRGIY